MISMWELAFQLPQSGAHILDISFSFIHGYLCYQFQSSTGSSWTSIFVLLRPKHSKSCFFGLVYTLRQSNSIVHPDVYNLVVRVLRTYVVIAAFLGKLEADIELLKKMAYARVGHRLTQSHCVYDVLLFNLST